MFLCNLTQLGGGRLFAKAKQDHTIIIMGGIQFGAIS
jgi:hypothetical protein